jgi:Uma2 family endonuclease
MMIADRPRVTLEEYYAFCALPENAGGAFELIDGMIIEKIPPYNPPANRTPLPYVRYLDSMPSYLPSNIASEIIFLLRVYLNANPIGTVTGEQGGYRLLDGGLFIPDVGYISHARLGEIPAREVPVPPDLAVEVLSPTDRLRDARAKVERYLTNGVPMVWLVMPQSRTVEVYTPDTDVTTLHADDALTGGAVLPGFSVTVRDLFPPSLNTAPSES